MMSKPFIFIHSPKTGGSSVTKFFKYRGDKIHRPASFYMDNFPEEFESHLVFSITRNPWDRLVSCYFYSCSASMGGLTPAEHRTAFPTFDSYVQALHENFLARGEDLAKPAPHTMFNPINVLSDMTSGGRVIVDYICSMHTLADDFELVRRMSGIPGELGHDNRSSHRDYRSYYTTRTTEMAATIFQRDIDYFGFCFDDLTTCTFDKVVNQSKVEAMQARHR